jgi:RNA polymerase sigma factor (TIGR02999 family)
MAEMTALLAAAGSGDKAAEARLFEAVYADLHRIAQRHLRASGPDAAHATSLVHEVYLRMARGDGLALNDRTHFFAVASRAMRQIVIDHVRTRHTEKRGGGVEAMSLDSAVVAVAEGRDEELLVLDEALKRLEHLDPRLARFVELRFYGGLQLEELADLVGLSERTCKRDWRKARAFLYREISGQPEPAAP